jgi:DUF1680 family protein
MAFNLNQVHLLDGPCRKAQELNRRYLHELDIDRLLHNFRINAGLKAPGKPLGGWEKPDCELRGHFIGYYLSACTLMYTSTGDGMLKAKADDMVSELAKCQQALDGEYLSAFPDSFFDRLEAGEKVWAPYYTIHKIMAGMLDMYKLCGNRQALDVLNKMAAYFKKRTDRLSTDAMQQVLKVEFGGMSEVLFNLYAITGKPKHLDLARRFERAEFLNPLAAERDNLSMIHANTHIPPICGAARAYELTGEKHYHTIGRFFWDRVANARSYATGGSTYSERWPNANNLSTTLCSLNQECCATHNMLKLTRYFIRWSGDVHYADFYERAFFNGILGTQHPDTGMLMYYIPLADNRKKEFGTAYDTFWCCTGTGIESFAKLNDSIYFHDEEGIYVNLFIASTVDWPEKSLRLEQRTEFPQEQGTTLIVHTTDPVTLALNLRVPYWATRGVTVKVNDQPINSQAKPASYLSIKRQWQNGDRVEVAMTMELYAHPMPDDPEMAAIMYGPLVLAGMAQEPSTYLHADLHNLNSWIKPVKNQPLTFRTHGLSFNITFVPLNTITDEAYTTYWLIIPENGPRHRQILADEQARQQLDARIVDRVFVNNKPSESAHNIRGENMKCIPFHDSGRREAFDGWFSWDLKVLGDLPMTILCTYWGSNRPPRTFDILVDGQIAATQTLSFDHPDNYYSVEYPIPEKLTRNKEKITIKFRAHPKSIAGGVCQCATLKPQQ